MQHLFFVAYQVEPAFHRIGGKEGTAVEETVWEQREELAQTDWVLVFLLLVIVSVLLSFAATVQQREDLVNALCQRSEPAADVFPLRWTASVLVTGATAFFAWLSCRNARQVQEQGDECAIDTARADLLAALMVFGAAVIRLINLDAQRKTRASE